MILGKVYIQSSYIISAIWKDGQATITYSPVLSSSMFSSRSLLTVYPSCSYSDFITAVTKLEEKGT